MVSITCPCIECTHNGRRNKCTAKKINLKWRNMLTVNEGRIAMWICDKHEVSEEWKELETKMRNFF